MRIIKMNNDNSLNSKKDDIFVKILAFIVSGLLIWSVTMLILAGFNGLFNLGMSIFLPLTISVILSAFISYKLIRNKKYLNSFEKILPYLGELVLPTILSSLFVLFVDTKGVDYDEEIEFTFCSLLFFIVLVEWFRRRKYKNDSPYLVRYLYVPIMVLAFILGIWYINVMAD